MQSVFSTHDHPPQLLYRNRSQLAILTVTNQDGMQTVFSNSISAH